MRLIEADKLLKQLEWLDTDDFILYEEVKKDIDEMPTVKAIPIEWIEQWLDRVTGTKDGDDISKYHDIVKGGILFINMLERDWEKENECRGTDKPD